jgi:hypothetical protein
LRTGLPGNRERAVEDAPLVQRTEALLGVALERDHVVYESRLKLSRLIFADFALRPARHHAEVLTLTLTGDSYRTRASRELLAKDNRTGE